MSPGFLTLILLNYALIGLLPLIFFRKDGSYNLMWFVTAAPIFLSCLGVLNEAFGLVSVPYLFSPLIGAEIVSSVLYAGSIAYITYTLGTHRVPLALWHQNNDAPVHIVTWGAYKWIRHPFYTSFLMSNLATLILLPTVISVIGMVWAFFILNATAAREEARLSASQFGDEYKAYIAKTGRFWPKVSK